MQESGDRDWLVERLIAGGLDVRALPCASSSRRPSSERENPWETGGVTPDVDEIVGALVAGDPSASRVVFVTDLEEDPVARVQAAVDLGRAAAAKGMEVLLVDADVRHVGLSRWVPDRDLDAEGFVDVLQYGSSVAAAVRPGPVEGVSILGIGSWRPEGMNAFEDADLKRLVAQLRGHAGLVLLIAPARLPTDRFQPLLDHVDAAVISMHTDPSLASSLSELLDYFAGLRLSLGGIFLFRGPDDADRFVDDALLERSRVLPRAREDSPFPGRSEPTEPLADVSGEAAAAPSGGTTPVDPVSEAAEPGEVAPVSTGTEEVPAIRMETERVDPTLRRARTAPQARRGSSGVVRGAVIGVLVLTLGFVGWWALTLRSAGPEGMPGERIHKVGPVASTDVAGEPASAEAGGPAGEPGLAESDAPVQGGGAAEPVEAADAAGAPAGTEQGAATGEAQAGDKADNTGEGDAPEEASVSQNRALEAVEPVVESRPDPVAESAVKPAVEPADPLEAALRRRIQGGWGLYWESASDSMEAVQDGQKLARKGYAVAIRGANVKGRRWFRILVGGFSTRSGAMEYVGPARDKFGVDWVGAARK